MRIVSLLSSATEILFGLGLDEQVLAVSHECDYPPAVQRLPKATRALIDSTRPSGQIDAEVQALTESGAALYEIDAALVANLRPDLIVTQAQCDVCAVRYEDVLDLVRKDRALIHTRVLALNPLTLADILDDVERVGAATGAEVAARTYAAALAARVDRISRLTAAVAAAARPRVVCLEWLEPLMAAGNWTPRLIELAGGQSGLAISGQHSGYVEPDAVREFNPEVLILAPCGFDLPRTIVESQALQNSPFWGRIAACQSGGVFAVDGNAYLNRSGPRIVESLEILAHLLHPALVGPPAAICGKQQPWARLIACGGRLIPA